jgi:RHS repeat-associated protein
MADSMLRVLGRLALAGALLSPLQASAFHFPWDQGHDTTDWNDPPPPGPCPGPVCTPCNSTGSPVYVPTGHLTWSETDVVLKGRPSIALVRTYNSRDPRDGLFGNGWAVGCDVALYRSDDGTTRKYVLRNPDGKRYEYVVQPDGSVASPAGRFEVVQPRPDGSVEILYPNASRRVFRADGKLVAEIDPGGYRLNHAYDGSGRLTQLADESGRALTIIYNSRGRVSQVTDHTGRTWLYTYDASGSLLSVADPAGGVRRYEYQPYASTGDGQTYQHLTRIVDASNVVVTAVTYSAERVASYSHAGNVLRYTYDTVNRRVTKTDSVSSTWRYTYTADGLITEELDPLGNRETFQYDANGNATRKVDQASQAWTATYDALGRVLAQTDPLGETTQYQYDGSNPKPVLIVTPSSRQNRATYDQAFNPLTITDAAGGVFSFEWSAKGDLAAVVDPLLNRSTVASTATGLTAAITDPIGRTTRMAYDGRGNLVERVGPSGETTRMRYDALDRIVEITDALGRSATFSYDAAGRLLSLTDSAARTTAYAYDSVGRLSQRTEPDGRRRQYAYRADNLLAQVTLPDGRAIVYTYDAAKRVTREDAAGDVYSFAYDARGLVVSASSAGGTVTRSHDAAGRLARETMHGQTVDLARNAEGERIRVSALGRAATYARDVRGLVTGISSDSDVFALSYDAAGRRIQLSLPNGSLVSYAYDGANQLTSLVHSGPFSAAYSHVYDASGRLTRLGGDGAEWFNQFDALGRLTAATHGAEAFAYGFDAAGNIIGAGRVHDAGNRVVQDDVYTYGYDANGNLISKQNRATGARVVYAWNARALLVRLDRFAAASATTPVKTVSFTYDAFGRRASKTEDGTLERYVYEGDDLIGVLDAAGAVKQAYLFGPGIDEPLMMMSGAARRYFHADHLGSVRALSDSTTVVARYDYDPYGVTRLSGEATNPFRYTGREQDADDLYYYRARYYDPYLQRFLSEDPAGTRGGLNLYAYADGNPAQHTDPMGRQAGSPEYCRRLLEKIRNVEQRIQKRIGELDEDPLNLPEACPGDDVKPSLSRRGHRRLINEDKALLAALKGLYAAYCQTPPPPVPVPAPQPAPQPETAPSPDSSTNTALLIGLGVLVVVGIGALIFFTGGAGAAALPAAASDRNLKEGFAEVDPKLVLERLSQLDVTSWRYKGEGERVRHIGPMAQDFHAAFGLGASDREITLVDANGVLIAAVQALYRGLQDKEAQVGALEQELAAQRQALARLERALMAQARDPGRGSADE